MREIETQAHFGHFCAVVHVSGARLQHRKLQGLLSGLARVGVLRSRRGIGVGVGAETSGRKHTHHPNPDETPHLHVSAGSAELA